MIFHHGIVDIFRNIPTPSTRFIIIKTHKSEKLSNLSSKLLFKNAIQFYCSSSRNLVKSPQLKEDFSINHSNRSYDVQSLIDFTTSFENDTSLNSFFQSPLRNPPSPESFGCTKMSSDSAFQSLGDGLELEQVSNFF